MFFLFLVDQLACHSTFEDISKKKKKYNLNTKFKFEYNLKNRK